MSQPAQEFDVVVLGGGSGGYACALRASQLGLTVALVEQERLGGTCLHAGCIPTKALLHVAEVAESINHSAALGLSATLDAIDAKGVQDYKNSIVDRLYKGLQGLIETASGITVVEGTGHVTAPGTVEVDGTSYVGRNLVVATGSSSRTLPGIDIGGRVLTSTEAIELSEIPSNAVIIGGSVIGVEIASAWKSLGVEITIVEALPNLVPLEDRALSKQLERAFRKRKIKFLTGTRVSGVTQDDSHVEVTLENGEVLDADYVLVAVGRGPNTADLGLEEVGIDIDRGWVTTDDRLRTSVDGVFAVGDVVRGLQLAHRGFAHGIFVAEEIAGLAPRPIADANIPRVTYCEPEIASVGLTEAQARDSLGDGVSAYEYNLAGNGKSQILQTTGLVKLVKGPDGKVVGVHMVGSRMGEQIGEAALLVDQGLAPEQVAHLVHAHPTQNEALGEALLALAGKPLHAHS